MPTAYLQQFLLTSSTRRLSTRNTRSAKAKKTVLRRESTHEDKTYVTDLSQSLEREVTGLGLEHEEPQWKMQMTRENTYIMRA